MINPPQVRPEEPTAVTPHGGICGGKSQQWLRTRQSRTSGSVRGDRGNPVPYRHRYHFQIGRSAKLLNVENKATGAAPGYDLAPSAINCQTNLVAARLDRTENCPQKSGKYYLTLGSRKEENRPHAD